MEFGLFCIVTLKQTFIKSTIMAFYLPRFSQKYMDKKMKEILQYYETDTLPHRITIQEESSCHIWDRRRSRNNEYRKVLLKESCRSLKVWIRTHQLVYFLFSGEFSIGDLEVSHLCNNKPCVNFHHLNLEPHKINLERRHCFMTNVCLGHSGYPNCIL